MACPIAPVQNSKSEGISIHWLVVVCFNVKAAALITKNKFAIAVIA
jgi:hypothetical protein